MNRFRGASLLKLCESLRSPVNRNLPFAGPPEGFEFGFGFAKAFPEVVLLAFSLNGPLLRR
jgi:hypothetical protein